MNANKVWEINEPYTVIAPGMINVCMNCYPGNSILSVFPDLAGVVISHGVCKGHKAKTLALLAVLKMGQPKRG